MYSTMILVFRDFVETDPSFEGPLLCPASEKSFMNTCSSGFSQHSLEIYPLKQRHHLKRAHTKIGATFALRVVTLVCHKEGLWNKPQYVS